MSKLDKRLNDLEQALHPEGEPVIRVDWTPAGEPRPDPKPGERVVEWPDDEGD